MIKLYKRDRDTITEYHEAFLSEGGITEHWGRLGETGSTKDHPVNPSASEEKNLEHVLRTARANGFAEVDEEDHHFLIVEYEVDGMGGPGDLAKRHALEDRLNETLGWTGLGHVDGGSIGSGTMEVCCMVVDFEKAAAVIRKDLEGTEFADYSKIYDEDPSDRGRQEGDRPRARGDRWGRKRQTGTWELAAERADAAGIRDRRHGHGRSRQDGHQRRPSLRIAQ